MSSRIRVGVVLITVFTFGLVYGGIPLFLIMSFVACYCVFELWNMLKNIDKSFSLPLGIAFSMAFLVDSYFFGGVYTDIIILSALIASFIYGLFTKDDKISPIENTSLCIFAIIYCGFTFGKFIMLRNISMEVAIFTLLLVWGNDVFCFHVGKKRGKNKLVPKISPNKTVEGAIAGLILTPILGVIYKVVVIKIGATGFNYSYLTVIILGIVIAIFSQFGDLVESAIKRQVGVKDSGKLLRGHGGMVDRFDSMVLTAPIVYYILSHIIC